VIQYHSGNDLDIDAMIDLYVDSTLGERRPVSDRERMAGMLRHANLVITAWDDDVLVGISRSVSDFHYATYLSDLAVRLSYQRRGLGRELIQRTRAAAPDATIILLAAPAAEEYYPRIGFTLHHSSWVLKPTKSLLP
jgi:predicted N-acetyltransferase YhbS